MLSAITESRPPERLSIKYIGVVNQGIDDTESDAAGAWAPSYENYTLKEIDVGTELTVDMDVPPEHEEIFSDTWPKAMAAIKRLAETEAG